MFTESYQFIRPNPSQKTLEAINDALKTALSNKFLTDFRWNGYLNYDLMTVNDGQYRKFFRKQEIQDFSLLQTALLSTLKQYHEFPERYKVDYTLTTVDSYEPTTYLLMFDGSADDPSVEYDSMVRDSLLATGLVVFGESFQTVSGRDSLETWIRHVDEDILAGRFSSHKVSLPQTVLRSEPDDLIGAGHPWNIYPGLESRVSSLVNTLYSLGLEEDFETLKAGLEAGLDKTAHWDHIECMDWTMHSSLFSEPMDFRIRHRNLADGIDE